MQTTRPKPYGLPPPLLMQRAYPEASSQPKGAEVVGDVSAKADA
jgi:hypothetical protein